MCHPQVGGTSLLCLLRVEQFYWCETDNEVWMGKSEAGIMPQMLGCYHVLMLLPHSHSTGYSRSMKIKCNTTQRCSKANIVMEIAVGERCHNTDVLLTTF